MAVDAERAHGFRYSQRAYLIQLRRAGAGTHLIDPIAFGQPADLSVRSATALADAEWVIHAASQDLPCLYEVGLVPRTLFDTELAARLLGYPRVALGTMLEELLGVRLLKEHSAADWSTRPLPSEWLNYAALDVELLVELRDRLAAELVASRQGRLGSAGVRGPGGWGRDSAPSRDPTRGGVRRASTRCGPDAAWPTSPSCGTPATRSPSTWTGRRARSCRTSPSANWPPGPRAPTGHQSAADSDRSPHSCAARPDGSRPTGCRRSMSLPNCEDALPPMHLPPTVPRSPGFGPRRTPARLPGWRLSVPLLADHRRTV